MAISTLAGRKRSTGLALVLAFVAVFAGLAPPVASATDGAATLDEIGYYPRLIRIAHSGAVNGTVLASTVGRGDGQKVGKIFASRNGGTSFQQIGTIKDPAAAGGRGMCCGTLFELPRQLGKLAPGTLLWAGTFGGGVPAPQRRMSLRMWASTDHGHNWRYVSTLRAASTDHPVYEPEFTMTAKGNLAAFYSDEFDSPRHSQVLRKTYTTDGIHWQPSQPLVTIDKRSGARAGMAVPLHVPNGPWEMAYEACNLVVRQCQVYLRQSTDGWNYGDPRTLGTEVRTANGHYPSHTPNLTWLPSPAGSGSLIMASQLLVTADNRLAPSNGKALLIKTFKRGTAWREFRAPVQVPAARDDFCPNFSPAVLRTADNRGVLQVSSDYVGNTCRLYYASGPT